MAVLYSWLGLTLQENNHPGPIVLLNPGGICVNTPLGLVVIGEFYTERVGTV